MLAIASTGEIVDIFPLNKASYLAYSMMGLFVALIGMPNISTYLYTFGGFMLPSTVVAVLGLAPLLCLPRIATYFEEVEMKKDADNQDVEATEVLDSLSFFENYFIYYLPDLVTFIQNTVFQAMVYALPLRLKRFNNIHETTTTWMMTSEFFMSFVSSIFITRMTVKTDMIAVMIIGTVLFYGGCVLCAGYTTVDLKVYGGALVGMILLGLADPTFITMCVMSKFYIYETLSKTTENMGEKASRTWKVALYSGALFGGVVAGQVTTRESEEWLFWVLGGAGVVCATALCSVWVYLRINKAK